MYKPRIDKMPTREPMDKKNIFITTERKNTTQKLNDWLNHQKQSKTSLSADLDFIMQRIQAENSMLDELATWYGKKSWLTQCAESAVILGTAAFMGAIAGHAILFSLVASLIYIPFVSFLSAHHASLVRKKQKLESNITELKKDQEETIEHINSLDEKLNQSVVDFQEKTDALAKETALIQEQTTEVAIKAKQLINTHENIQSNAHALTQCVESFDSTLEKAIASFEACQQAISEESAAAQSTQEASTCTTLALYDSQKQLAKTNQEFADTHAKLSFFSKAAETALNAIIKQITPPGIKDAHHQSTSKAIIVRPAQTLEIPLKRLDSLIDTANVAIKRHDAYVAASASHSEKLSQQVKMQLEESDRLLERLLKMKLATSLSHF